VGFPGLQETLPDAVELSGSGVGRGDCNDLPHHDLGGGPSLDRSLADTLPIRRERSNYMALA
jgi:hypothetical protein